MTVEKLTVVEISVDDMTKDEMLVEKMTETKMTRQNDKTKWWKKNECWRNCGTQTS